MRRRHGVTRLAIAVLVALLAPLIGGQRAEASDNVDNQSGTLEFLDFSDNVVTCVVINDSEHNTDTSQHPTLGIAWGGTPGDECVGNSMFTIAASWKDRNGVTRTFAEQTSSPGNLTLDGVSSAVHTEVTARFLDCDPDFSVSCSIGVTAAPK